MQYVLKNNKKGIQENPITGILKCSKSIGKPEGTDRFVILLHYLHTGLMHEDAPNDSEIKKEALLSETCREEWRQVMEYLLTILEDEEVYFRLLQIIPETELRFIVNGISEAHSQKLGEDLQHCFDLLLHSEDLIPDKHIRHKTAAMLLSECLKWRGNGPVPDLFQMTMIYLPDEEMRKSFRSLIRTDIPDVHPGLTYS